MYLKILCSTVVFLCSQCLGGAGFNKPGNRTNCTTNRTFLLIVICIIVITADFLPILMLDGDISQSEQMLLETFR